MFSLSWSQIRTKIVTYTVMFIIWVFLLEFLSWLALLFVSHLFPSLDLRPVAVLLAAIGIPLLMCCLGIWISIAKKWNKPRAFLFLLTPIIVVLGGTVVAVRMVTNPSTTTMFSEVLKGLLLLIFLFVCFAGSLLLSWHVGKALWTSWRLRWQGVNVIGRIMTTWTHLSQHAEDSDYYAARVAFTTLAGENCSIEISRTSKPYLPGSDLPVTYHPHQAAMAVEATPPAPIRWSLGFLVGLLLYLFFCVYGTLGFAYLLVEAVLSLIGIR